MSVQQQKGQPEEKQKHGHADKGKQQTVRLPAQGTAAAERQEAAKGSAAKGTALPKQSEAPKESGAATGSAAPKGPEEIIAPADNDHAQDETSEDEGRKDRKEEQNHKRKRRDKRSTAQRKKSKK
ncbi:uncharacterized protein [Montipora foliosa]|uniref:uncharacterized protein n=1 Tax=Montipora foliosa TaxID=591990 RepID=UPI0035F16199